MKRYLLVLAACVAFSSTAYAATSFWTKTAAHYTVYSNLGYASMTFATAIFSPPLGLSTPSISSIVYTWNPYPNGNTNEKVELCFTRFGSSTFLGCIDVTLARTGTSSAFNGENAKGMVSLKHTLTGGTYPANGAGVSDTVTVNYTY